MMGKQEPEKPQKKKKGNTIRVLKYVTRFWQLKAILAFIVVVTIMDNFSPAIIGSIIDIVKSVASGETFVPGKGISGVVYWIMNPIASWVSTALNVNRDVAILGVFASSLILLSVLTGLLNYLQRYALSYVSQMGSYNLRGDIYNSLLDQSFSFYDQQRTGQLLSRATSDINQIEGFFNWGLRMTVSSTLTG
ncbi:MAG: ABC transporter transmembrane domain-containing protein, partial [Candidatus Bathyarchaeota archaeon]|nr:ABC transporter transmembrane domain-containing protein [Candidatus Bathyarchaeota archaeon]